MTDKQKQLMLQLISNLSYAIIKSESHIASRLVNKELMNEFYNSLNDLDKELLYLYDMNNCIGD